MTGYDTDGRGATVDRGLELIILAVLVIAIGLVTVVAVGIGARIVGLSAASFMQVLLIAVLFWPVYRLEPWRPGVADRVRGWVQSNRLPVALTAILILGSQLPFAPDVLVTVVHFPFVQTSGFFFGAELFYRPYVGFETGEFVRRFGQWYVTVFFVLVISVFVVNIGKSMWSGVDDGR